MMLEKLDSHMQMWTIILNHTQKSTQDVLKIWRLKTESFLEENIVEKLYGIGVGMWA